MKEIGEGFDSWAIVEVMGFKKLAGHVTEQQLAGASLVRVDVPECVTGETIVPAYSKLVGVGSIYMITPTDEATARKAARVLAHQNDPLPLYIPPEPKQIPATSSADDEEGHLVDEDFPGFDDDDDDGQDVFDHVEIPPVRTEEMAP